MNHGIPSPLNLFVTHTIQLVASCKHKEKGESDKRAYLKSEHKNVISGKDRAAFFHNIENKQVLCIYLLIL